MSINRSDRGSDSTSQYISSLRKKGGPNNYRLFDFSASGAVLVPSSAGFSRIGTHLHSDISEFSRISAKRSDTKILKLRTPLFIQCKTILESLQKTCHGYSVLFYNKCCEPYCEECRLLFQTQNRCHFYWSDSTLWHNQRYVEAMIRKGETPVSYSRTNLGAGIAKKHATQLLYFGFLVIDNISLIYNSLLSLICVTILTCNVGWPYRPPYVESS